MPNQRKQRAIRLATEAADRVSAVESELADAKKALALVKGRLTRLEKAVGALGEAPGADEEAEDVVEAPTPPAVGE